MLLLGIDLGTSSVKVSVVDTATSRSIASATFPEIEAPIESLHPGWAEQSPDEWWIYVQQAVLRLHAQKKYDPADIIAIGIAYQMHGLVMVDKDQVLLGNSIIWCDSRAVSIGENAFEKLGKDYCLSCLLNSPGNFTGSKLSWVKLNEPLKFSKIDKFMLPGDFISMKLTGEITTTISALSEGIFWDFKKDKISQEVLDHFDFDHSIIPQVKNVFDDHGRLPPAIASALSLKPGIPVSYKAGDQPNNALSLNVLQPGEIAATAGTSGVIYGVTDQMKFDSQSRVNSFAHVNYKTGDEKRIGVLLCINGTGIMNKWIREQTGRLHTYDEMNKLASNIPIGSEGLSILPFGNGVERMLNNKNIGARLMNIDLNLHSPAHLYRAVQEGIAFGFRYGLDIMKSNGLNPSVIRAGKANMFLSEVFNQAFVNVLNTPLELYDADGSVGAALGAGIGAGIYKTPADAFQDFRASRFIEPTLADEFTEPYHRWLDELNKLIN